MKLNTEVLKGIKFDDLPVTILKQKIKNDIDLFSVLYQIEIFVLTNQIKELNKLIDNK